MHILFLDANILFSAAYQINSGILRFWKLTNVKLITSLYAVEEAQRNLKEIPQKERLKKLLKSMHVSTITHDNHLIPEGIILPLKDQPILSAAIANKANYLITGDYKDFGSYFSRNISEVIILPPAEYLSNYSKN